MKVQCGQCPAKYAVSDERVQDKKVRIHCKRCGASIVVDGKVDPPLVTSTPARKSQRPATAPPDSEPPPEREPDSRPSPRPVAHTIMGGLEAPAAERLRSRSAPPPRAMRSPASPPGLSDEPPRVGMPAYHRGLTDPPPGADESRWRVALTKQDLRWMTTGEIVDAYHAGAVKLETFVFRTGMPTWVTLLEVPEIAEALAAAGEAELNAGASSVPPPRSPSSQPPPRRLPPRTGASEANSLAELAALDASEPMPFALVAERSNGGSPPPPAAPSQEDLVGGSRSPRRVPPTVEEAPNAEMPVWPGSTRPSPGQRGRAEPVTDSGHEVPGAALPPVRSPREAPPPARAPEIAQATAPLPAYEQPGPPPFAAAREASGSSRWVWVAVVLLLLGAVAALIGPRYGLKLL